MLKLSERTPVLWEEEPFITRLTTNPTRPGVLRPHETLLWDGPPEDMPRGFRAHLFFPQNGRAHCLSSPEGNVIPLSSKMAYLADGDIVRINPRVGEIGVLYRKTSYSNTIFLTGQCNCRCIMCPQPPVNGGGACWVGDWLQAIPLMSTETVELGISGGEPTLFPEELLRIIRVCRNYLPSTALHLLTNGRMFNYLSFCRELAEIKHPDLVIGIPLYCDLSYVHDYVVQCNGAYDQTIRGLANLARLGQRIELRVVFLPQSVGRLKELARFIVRNLPFVEHVAWMGLEPTGYALAKVDSLWISPNRYREELVEAVDELVCRGMTVSIYNHPLCVLHSSLWPYARKSISDWKREYSEVCGECSKRHECGGFFSSAKRLFDALVVPIQTTKHL